jgi:hypothetical protein
MTSGRAAAACLPTVPCSWTDFSGCEGRSYGGTFNDRPDGVDGWPNPRLSGARRLTVRSDVGFTRFDAYGARASEIAGVVGAGRHQHRPGEHRCGLAGVGLPVESLPVSRGKYSADLNLAVRLDAVPHTVPGTYAEPISETRFPEIVQAHPALLAQHCAEAGLAEKAVAYWLKGGQQALDRSAMTEAVALLRRGLDMLAGLLDGPWRWRQELDLLIALRPALAATKGWSGADVETTLTRARELAEQLDLPDA